MPFAASANDVFQVKVVGKIEAQETNNLFYFSANTSDADVELHLILVLATCFINHLVPVMSNKWNIERLVWKRIYPTLSNEMVTVPSGDLIGDVATDSLPSFNSALISTRTDKGGRSYRGRTYLAGAPESATVGSNFDTGGAFWTGVVAFCACLASNFITGDPPAANSYQALIYSRKISGSHFPLPNTTGLTSVVSWTPIQAVATTRSRKVGRGS